MNTPQLSRRIPAASGFAHRQILEQIAFASIVGVFALGVFLMFRRASGALLAPIPSPLLFGTSLALATCAVCINLPWSLFGKSSSFAVRAMTTVAVILFAIACSYPGSRAIEWLAWLPTFAAAAFTPQIIARLPKRRKKAPVFQAQPAEADEKAHALGVNDTDDREQVLQQITRFRSGDGGEVVHATLTAEFPPGERIATLYLAFWPPFEYLPEIEANVADGPDAQVKVAQLLHNGTQLEVQLSGIHSATQLVSIEVLAAEQPLAD